MSKILVAYFSASGVTKAVAEALAKEMGADLFAINPKIPYTAADLDWMDKQSRSSLETRDVNCRPEITESVVNMESYDTIFLGFPIWWYVAPKIINTFVTSYDLSGKKVIPFATSGGSGMGKTVEVLRELCPEAIWNEGKILNRVSMKEIEKWLKDVL